MTRSIDQNSDESSEPSLGGSGLTRRDLTRRAAAIGLTLPSISAFLAACGGDDDGASQTQGNADIASEPNGALRVFEWQGYDYPTFKAAGPYAKPFGTPKYTYITDPSQMITKVNSGFRVDLTHPTLLNIPAMIAFEMIQPWDMSLITRRDQLEPSALEVGQVSGDQYLMPFDSGTNSVLIRSDRVDDPGPDAYSLLYDSRYKGKISWYDYAIDNLVIWGLMNGVDDPMNMTDDELAQAKEFLIAHKPLVRNLWSLQTSLEQDMAAGNVLVAHALGASYPSLKSQGVQVSYPWPKEGRLVYNVGYALSKDTSQFAHAHKFADTMLSPAAGLELTNSFGYIHPNKDVDLAQVDPDTVKTLGIGDPSSLEPPKGFVIKDQASDRVRAYEQAWSEVKAA